MYQTKSRGSSKGRLLIALVIAAISIISYFGSNVYNEVTGENQHISMTQDQEITLGLQAAPEMAEQFGGLSNDRQAQQLVKQLGSQIVSQSDASQANYPFDFHVLADRQTVNAFALPGGQIFITEALMDQLQTEGQLAGVLAHEIGHVVGRHSAEHIAKAQLTQGLTGAAVIASYDPDNPSSAQRAQMAALIGQLINLKFSRNDELESDRLGVRFMSEAGYDPGSMVDVMEILARAGGPNRQPEFLNTHPDPGNRVENIQQAIQEQFPDGVPNDLVK